MQEAHCHACMQEMYANDCDKREKDSQNQEVLQRRRISRRRESIQMQVSRYAEPMLRERWDEIVPADDDANKRGSKLG